MGRRKRNLVNPSTPRNRFANGSGRWPALQTPGLDTTQIEPQFTAGACGARCPLNVANYYWDLYDTSSDGPDTVSIGLWGILDTVGFGGGHTTTPQVEVIPQDNVAFARYLQTAGVCDLPKVGVNTASPRFLLGTVVATLLSDTVFPELALAGPGFAPPTIDPDALLPTCDASEFGPQLCSCRASDPGCSPIFPFVVSPHVFGFEKTAEPQQRLRIGGRLARVTR